MMQWIELRILFPTVSNDARIVQKSQKLRPQILDRGFGTMLELSLKVLKGQPWVRAIKGWRGRIYSDMPVACTSATLATQIRSFDTGSDTSDSHLQPLSSSLRTSSLH